MPAPAPLRLGRSLRSLFTATLAALAACSGEAARPDPTGAPSCAIACCDRACADGAAPEFLIVTRPMFVDALQPFVRFKHDQGYAVGVVTLESLVEARSGASHVALADGLKQALAAYHARGTRFALLVGDARVTPLADGSVPSTPGAHAEMDSLALPWSVPTGYYFRDLPDEKFPSEEYSDVFFADLADWDPDRDGVNGSLDTVQSDLGAMLLLGRWPVRTAAEIAAITDKTIDVAGRAARGELPRKQHVFASTEFGATDDLPAECSAPYETSEAIGWYMQKATCERGLSAARAALERAGFVSEFHPSAIEPTELERATFDRLFGSPGGMVLISYHGNHDYLAAPTPLTTTNVRFEATFPLLANFACLVAGFEHGDDDALDEALIKAVPGPAIVASPGNTRALYERIAAGRSIGEAFYASKLEERALAERWRRAPGMWLGSGNGLTLQANDVLFGDPSLVLYPSR